jgi:hypothetical protein
LIRKVYCGRRANGAWVSNLAFKAGLEHLWRKRLADMARRFRRLRGRWPDKQVMEAAAHGYGQAIKRGLRPPIEH